MTTLENKMKYTQFQYITCPCGVESGTPICDGCKEFLNRKLAHPVRYEAYSK